MTAIHEESLDRIQHILSEIPFFNEFTTDDIVIFSKNLSLRFFPENTCLFKGGEIGDYLFFVVNGIVEVQLQGNDQRQMIVASFGPSCSVGEMSLIDDYPRSATVLVKEAADLLLLSKKRFHMICEEHPTIGLKFLQGIAKNLSDRLRKANGRFADFA